LEIINKLDLENFIENFKSFFARDKELYLQGDLKYHLKYIDELSKFEFDAPSEVKDLDTQIVHLKKFGVLKPYEIFEFLKIVRYFVYLKNRGFKSELLTTYLEKIVVPEAIKDIDKFFDKKGALKEDIDEELYSVVVAIKNIKAQIKESFLRLVNTQKLSNYLVDRQVHYVNDEEALLVRGGFNHVLKASVIARSSGGFFYVTPESIQNLKSKEAELLSKKDKIIYEICKDISSKLLKNISFLTFINKEFDRFDSYQARLFFAKARNLEFIVPSKDREIILKDFCHPALSHPKPTDIEFDKSILMVTGVNAGGKTMLLKSILSSVFLAKYLIPMRINSNKSKIAHFKEITAIIDDPQNVKNDISTFAGRMLEFSKLFGKSNTIVGVDEIELGTDADEAASLFKVILEDLIKKDIKLIITTHHKRLASFMAGNEKVNLLAALYDERKQEPTFDFLAGTIGKSYAFETAVRYKIPSTVVSRAKEVYGEDKEKLNELIERSVKLELELREKSKNLDFEVEKAKSIRENLEFKREELFEQSLELKSKLQREYDDAINEAKRAIKAKDNKDSHRYLNNANKILNRIKIEKQEVKREFSVGDIVKYRKSKGTIISLKSKEALIESDGFKLRVPIAELKHSQIVKTKRKSKINIEKPKKLSVSLDLHGLRSEEAIERADKFLSDSLLSGFDEVLIYHGIGTGKLAYGIREFLKTHPSVIDFSDAPANMGGFGATVVKL